jgi:hypothetical protein
LVRILALVLALLAAGLAGAVAQQSHPLDPGQQLGSAMLLNKIIGEIDGVLRGVQRGNDALVDRLPRPMAMLNEIIAEGRMSGRGMSLAHFYRALGRKLQSDALVKKGIAVDPDAARDELADFDQVLQLVPDDNLAASAAYLAGGIAYYDLHDVARGYGYWRRCAALQHPGCLEIAAEARITGADGQPPDTAAAGALLEKVYAGGGNLSCSGAYAALALAELQHFTAPDAALDGELRWMKRAYDLLDALGAKGKGDERACDRGAFELTEFLLRLSAGERRDELLRQAALHSGEAQTKAAAQYLAGTLDDAAFAAALARVDPTERCAPHFLALWYLALTKRPDAAAGEFAAMSTLGADNCRSLLVFARKLGFPA